MDINPYESPVETTKNQSSEVNPMACPECGQRMEAGFVTTAGRLYWRSWRDRSWLDWLFRGFHGVPGTHPAFVGSNKLSGFRCFGCELIILRFGRQKGAYAPTRRG